jgi:hypothetical protein
LKELTVRIKAESMRELTEFNEKQFLSSVGLFNQTAFDHYSSYKKKMLN